MAGLQFSITQLPDYSITKFPMDISNLPPAVVLQIANAVEDYITGSRRKYQPQAVPLSASQRATLAPSFSAEILDSARLCVLNNSRIEDPAFYGMARMMGLKNLPDFSSMAAITLVDVIVSHQEFTDSLLFHELVHAVQYAKFGSKDFALRYVKGFISGGSYEQIPLEKNAYELEARFSQDKAAAFSVADEVKNWIVGGRL
jgi:hypothetical protein